MPVLEHRRGGSAVLFVLVVVAHIILISAQVTSKSGMPVLQAVAFGLVAEVQRGGAGAVDAVTLALERLRGPARHARRERAAAPAAGRRADPAAAGARAGAAQRASSTRAARAARAASRWSPTAAEVIAASATPDFRTVTIGKGTTSGLRPDMAVLSPEGVVGRVIVPSARAAKVQLLIDRNAAAGALVERTRAQGVADGHAARTSLQLEYVLGTVRREGRRRRRDLRHRRHLPEGLRHRPRRLRRARRRRLPRRSASSPAVDFTSLEDVLVVLTPQAPDATPAPRPPRRPERAAMKTLVVVVALALALVLQTRLAPFLVLGTSPLDLVLIVVVYVAITSGPTTGLLAGAAAGLAQDALSSGILGIGGLAKTVVGYLVGLASTQFIVAGPLPRFLTFLASTVIHAGDLHGAVRAAEPARLRLSRGAACSVRASPTRWSASSCCRRSSCCPAPPSGGSSAAAAACARRAGWTERRHDEPAEAGEVPTLPHRGAAGGRRRGLPPAGRHVLVLPDHPARAVPRDGREQPSARAGAARAARRALRPQRHGSWSRTAPATPSRSSACTRPISIGPSACWRPSPASRSGACARSSIGARHLPSYRPIVVIQDATLSQVAAIMARRLDFELPDVVVERVPTRRYPTDAMAAHLLGYVGEATDAQLAADNLKPGAIVGQAGIERTHNRDLMGTDGARTVVVNSLGREIRDARRGRADRGAAAAADHRLRRAEGRRGRLQGARLLGRGGGASTRAAARCCRS